MPNTGLSRSTGILLGLTLAAGLIISAAQVTRAWLHIADSQTISVTGASREDVTSDLAVWSATFSAESEKLSEAQQQLRDDFLKVQAFFKQHGITNAEISAISIKHLKTPSNSAYGDEESKKTVGYRLAQGIRLELMEVQRVLDIQQQSGSLVQEGVELDDRGVEFIYTKTAEAKINMLASAAKDARQRAEQIASQGGRKIKGMRSAKMGVFQITPRNSNETSALGVNDVTSRDKTIRAVVSATFSME
jgi:hypothetical protein